MASLNCDQAAPADECASEGEEGSVDVIADLPADPYPAEPVKMGEGALNDTVLGTEPGAVLGTAAGRSRPAARAGSAAPAHAESESRAQHPSPRAVFRRTPGVSSCGTESAAEIDLAGVGLPRRRFELTGHGASAQLAQVRDVVVEGAR